MILFHKLDKNLKLIWIFQSFSSYNPLLKPKLLFTLSSPHRPTLPLLQRAVSSAKKSLTARFGMELGGTSSLLARR